MHVSNCKKKIVEWNSSNLEISIFFSLSKIYSTDFFLIFPVSSSVANKKIFRKKKPGVTSLVKKWVKFVALTQNSTT